MEQPWVLQEARIDWITATAATGPDAIALFDVGASILVSEREKGNYGRTTNFEGYHGTVSKNCFAGYRTDGCCVRLGGQLAGHRWRDVAGAARNITRLDIAVTALRTPPDPDYPRKVWDELPTATTVRGRPTDYSLIQSRNRGETLYCGRRASEHFGRIYDKHAESLGEYPEGTFRFEIEYKGQAAKDVAGYLKTNAATAAVLVDMVKRRFKDWGVLLPIEGADWGFRPKVQIDRSDNESRMKWLREQVSVTVEKLAASYTAREIREALGLKDGTIDAFSEDDPRRRYFANKPQSPSRDPGFKEEA